MSEDWTRIIPEDPRFVPDKARQTDALECFRRIAPLAAEYRLITHDAVEFFDCGGNFERILCPTCNAELPITWWHDCMNRDYAAGFKLLEYPTPCCNTPHALHELRYDWTQGFGRFALDVRDAGIGRLEEHHVQELSRILGTPVRVIYQHI